MQRASKASRRLALAVVFTGALAACSLFTDFSGLLPLAPDQADTGGGMDSGVVDGPSVDVAADGSDANAVSAYALAVLADNPIAYYPLEETSGNVATDIVGGQNASWSGTPTLGVPGIVGRGATFDGDSARLEMPKGLFGFGPRKPFTIELWFRAAVVDTSVRSLFDQGLPDGAPGGYTSYFARDFFLASRSSPDGSVAYVNAPLFSAGVATHIVLAYSGSAVTFFRDGVLEDTNNSPHDVLDGPDERLVFGDFLTGSTNKFAGLLDEIAIFDKSLNEARVAAHYAARP